jgi:hypothetical protein
MPYAFPAPPASAPPRPHRAATAPHLAPLPYRDEPDAASAPHPLRASVDDDDDDDEPRLFRTSLHHAAAPLTGSMAEHSHPPHAGFSAAAPQRGSGHGASGSLGGLLEPIAQPARRWYREQSWTQARPKTDNKRRMQVSARRGQQRAVRRAAAGAASC